MTVGLGQPLARGSRSVVYEWGRGAVAKVPFPSTPPAWIHHEARYTAAVRAIGAPVPRLLGIETVDGRAASIYERIVGRSMWEHVLDRPTQAAAHARSLAGLQFQLFSLVPPVTLPAQHDRLAVKIRRAAAAYGSELSAALTDAPTPCPGRLCHGDLHPGNVILGADGPVIIDWFDAARGDATADIARTSVLLCPEGHGPSGHHHLPGASDDLLAAVHDAYLTAIAALVPFEPIELRRWVAVVAVARLSEGVEPDGLLALRREHGMGAAVG